MFRDGKIALGTPCELCSIGVFRRVSVEEFIFNFCFMSLFLVESLIVPCHFKSHCRGSGVEVA